MVSASEHADGEVDLERSSYRLICRFTFPGNSFRDIQKNVEAAEWHLRKRPLRVWVEAKIDSESMVEEIADFIFAEENPSVVKWKAQGSICQSPMGLASDFPWWLDAGRGRICLKFRGAELMIFSSGIGFVVLEMVPTHSPFGEHDSLSPTQTESWVELARAARLIRDDRAPSLFVGESVSDTQSFGELIPAFPRAGGILARTEGTGRLKDIADALVSTLGLPAAGNFEAESDENSRVEVVLTTQACSYITLFLNGSSDAEARDLVLRLRAGARAGEDMLPSLSDLGPEDAGAYQRSKSAWLFASPTAIGFVGFDLPRTGYYGQLHHQLAREYQLCTLFVLQQRHALLELMRSVGEAWLEAKVGKRVRAFRTIQESLHSLMARGMTSQLMQRRAPHRFYGALQSNLQVNELYEQVRSSVSDLNEAVRMQLNERIERNIALFALLFGVPSVVLTFLGINIRGLTAPDAITLRLALAFVALALLVGILLTQVLLKPKGERWPPYGRDRKA
jgi:hypothetical protein